MKHMTDARMKPWPILVLLAIFAVTLLYVFPGLIGKTGKDFRFGLDLQGGASLVYDADLSKVPAAEQNDALAGVRDVIERRVNSLGVAEASVVTSRSGDVSRVNVDLPGVQDVAAAVASIGDTPLLEFKTQKEATGEADDVTKEKNAEYLKQAQALLARVQKREDFAKLVAEASAFKGTAGDGVTDWVSRNSEWSEVVKELEKARLYKGYTAPRVIESNMAYHVVRIADARYSAKEYEASHILICYKGATGCTTETSKEDALKKAQQLATTATIARFPQLVAENSTEPGAAESKGKLEWFSATDTVKPFSDAVEKMRVGEITRIPVETEFGYHIVWKSNQRVLPEYKLQVIQVEKHVPVISIYGDWESTGLTGSDLKTARVEWDQTTGIPSVGIVFSTEGGKKFAEITKANVGKQLAIFLDGSPISAPTVQGEITAGEAQITGNFTLDEAKTLARRLNAGALPVPISLVSEQTVGPTLGKVALDQSMKAGLIGLVVVMIYMIGFYRLPGIVSGVALIVYALINLSIFKGLPITLSLASVAGFIISIGMAVDGNVLIFERMKEELRAGKSLQAAVEEGFTRAWASIWDGHFTTMISALTLFFLTSSVIRGFALTLLVGVLVSLFSSMWVSRTLLRIFARARWAQRPWLFGVKG